VAAIGALLSGIASIPPAFFGDKGLIEGTKSVPCGLSTFNEQNYKQAEEAFFREFDSRNQPNNLNLWKQNGSPRPLGEILISQSRELVALRDAITNRRVLYSPNQLIFVYGSAGSGKSTVARQLAVGDSVSLIDLGKLGYNPDESKEHPMTKPVTDLKIDNVELSQMADLKPKEKEKEFIQLLTDIAKKNVENKTSIIIDGLDELHPRSSTHILTLAREYLTKNSKKNIIFFGRGESFRGYIEKFGDSAVHEAIYVESLYLKERELRRWYIAQFLAYPYLEKNPDYVPNPEKVDKILQQVTDIVNQKPELHYFLQTTEPANALLRNLEYDGEKLSEFEFLDLIKRNRKTHNRPSPEKSEFWPLYEQALIQAARTLKPEKRRDGRITAIVKPFQRINLQHNGKCVSQELSQVLDRSGVASLNPFNKTQLEYIFQPVTMQKFIAERETLSGVQGR
jgi:predicted kinase